MDNETKDEEIEDPEYQAMLREEHLLELTIPVIEKICDPQRIKLARPG